MVGSALQAASRYETWLITRGDQQEEEIRDYLAKHGPIPNLHVEFLACPGFPKQAAHVGGRLWLAYGDGHSPSTRARKSCTPLTTSICFTR